MHGVHEVAGSSPVVPTKSMTYLYFLYSESDQGWYIGQTTLLPEDRLKWHNGGRVRSTKSRRPFLLAYVEQYETFKEACKREWHLKHPKGYQEKIAIVHELLTNKFSWPRRGPFGPRTHAWGA